MSQQLTLCNHRKRQPTPYENAVAEWRDTMRIPVMLCCNDPDNGDFCGRVIALEIGSSWEDVPLKIESNQIDGAALQINRDHIRISGKRFNSSELRYWVGNWCWNCVCLNGNELLKMLNHRRFRELFYVDEAEDWMREMWEKNGIFTDEHLQHFLRA